jgi:hypothetical protein
MKMNIVLPLRGVQVALSLVVIGLSGYVVSWYRNIHTSSPAQINFLIFAALWSIFSVVYLEVVTKFFPKGALHPPLRNKLQSVLTRYVASHPYVPVAVEFTNVTFFFSGFVALGVFLSKLDWCRGAVCSSAQADTAFAAFLFIIWGVTIFYAGKEFMKAGFRRAVTAKMNGALPPMKEADA